MAHLPRLGCALTIGALGLALASCNIFVNVPQDLQGDVHVDITNRLDADICNFSMTPRGTPVPRPLHSWLRTANVGPGSGRVFKIKPGDYRVDASGCDNQFYGFAYVHIAAPTSLLIGFPGDAIASANPVVLVPVVGRVGRFIAPTVNYGGGAGGEAAPAGGESGGDNGGESGGESSSEPSSSDSSSSESSDSSENKTEEPAPANSNPNCKPSGATCDQSYQCCSGACVTHSPDDYCR